MYVVVDTSSLLFDEFNSLASLNFFLHKQSKNHRLHKSINNLFTMILPREDAGVLSGECVPRVSLKATKWGGVSESPY